MMIDNITWVDRTRLRSWCWIWARWDCSSLFQTESNLIFLRSSSWWCVKHHVILAHYMASENPLISQEILGEEREIACRIWLNVRAHSATIDQHVISVKFYSEKVSTRLCQRNTKVKRNVVSSYYFFDIWTWLVYFAWPSSTPVAGWAWQWRWLNACQQSVELIRHICEIYFENVNEGISRVYHNFSTYRFVKI